MRLIFTLFLLLGATSAGAELTFTGYARHPDSGALLYVETHAVKDAGKAGEQRVVLYRIAPEAAPFARKHLVFSATRSRPGFEFEDRRSGFAESFAARGALVSARAGSDAAIRSKQIPESRLVVDAGFDEFVRENWQALQRGEPLIAPFLVPSRLTSYNFRVRKVAGERIEGSAASVIRLSLSSALGWFLPDIDVAYRDSDRRLLRYRGLTNIRDASGKLLEAQIDFPDSGRTSGPVDLDALRALPLSAGG
jgi:hypothetical protein